MNHRDENSNDFTGVIVAVFLAIVCVVFAGVGLWFFTFQSERVMEVEMVELEAREQAIHKQNLLEQKAIAEQDSKLRVLTWNVESGGNDPAVIATQIAELGDYDIWGLCEVNPANVQSYTSAAGDDFKSIVSETGRSDRLVLVYDSSELELIEHSEMESFEETRLNDDELRHRSPLLGKFKDKRSGVEFQVVLVHLARGRAELRQEQALGLRTWASAQEVPSFAIGDFNFDYDFPTQKGNKAFDIFTDGDTWHWVKPATLVDTNWSDRDGDGNDNYPDSCLDFVFISGEANSWKAESKVIVRDGDFPDDETTSDHRPVELSISL